MRYYIDGYNLMFRIRKAEGELSKQRQRVIEDLSEKASFLGLDVVLVFDAHYQPGEGTKSHHSKIEIRYTSKGETADDYIIHAVRAEPNPLQVTVVTSDKKLAWYVRRKSAKTETIDEFLSQLTKRCRNKIRREKEAKETPPPVPAAPPASKPAGPPSGMADPEACFDYYLHAFEASFEEIRLESKPAMEAAGKKEAKRTKKIQKPVKPEKRYASEMERWQDLFESNVRDEID